MCVMYPLILRQEKNKNGNYMNRGNLTLCLPSAQATDVFPVSATNLCIQ